MTEDNFFVDEDTGHIVDEYGEEMVDDSGRVITAEDVEAAIEEHEQQAHLESLDFSDPEIVAAVREQALADENHPWHEITVQTEYDANLDALAAETGFEVSDEIREEFYKDPDLVAEAMVVESEEQEIDGSQEGRRAVIAARFGEADDDRREREEWEKADGYTEDPETGEARPARSWDLDKDEERREYMARRATGEHQPVDEYVSAEDSEPDDSDNEEE